MPLAQPDLAMNTRAIKKVWRKKTVPIGTHFIIGPLSTIRIHRVGLKPVTFMFKVENRREAYNWGGRASAPKTQTQPKSNPGQSMKM